MDRQNSGYSRNKLHQTVRRIKSTPVKCYRYTYYPSDGLCTLHEQCTTLSEECEDCVSGQANCPACNIPGQCEGVNFHLEPEVDPQQCLVVKFES